MANDIKLETDDEYRASPSYWYNWKQAAVKAAKSHYDISTRAYNEYLLAENSAKGAADTIAVPPARFPLFWSSIKNLQPAYYARTPETVAKRMFDDDDQVARTGSIVIERLSKYLLSQYPIDAAMINATYDFLITDKATARVYFEDEREIYQEQVQVIQNELGELIDIATGEILPPEAEVVVGEDGFTMFATIEQERIVKVCTEILPVSFGDVIHTPNAANWCDVDAVGFRLWLDRGKFVKLFGADKLKYVSFGQQKESDQDEVTKNEDNANSQYNVTYGVEVWEIWDKLTKKVRYICGQTPSKFLKEIDDPYKLRDFFPCAPFIIGTKPPKSLYPTPMFKQLEPIIDQLHRLFTRITRMTSALRRRGIADKSMTDVIESLNNLDDFEIIGSSHFQQLVESKAKGADPIWYLPLTELSNALVEAQNLLASYKQLFFEISGVPDVVRGVTDYRETASAQQQKGQFYNVRSSWDQHLIQELARKLIEMQIDLALATMPDDMLITVCHLQGLEPEIQTTLPAAFEMLRNTEQRVIRIDIETDSLTFVQDQTKQEQKNLIVTTVMQGLTQVAQIAQSSPAFLKPAMQMLMMSLRGVDLGKAYEQSVESALDAFEEASNQPLPPPPPDYEGMKIQMQQQEMMQKAQLEANKMQLTQLEAQIKQAELQIKQFTAQADAARQDKEIALKAQEIEQDAIKLQTDAALKTQELQLQAGAIQSKMDIDQMNAELKAMESALNQQLETQKMQLEEMSHAMTMQEKLMEEKRLARDSEIQIAKTMLEQEKMQVELQKMLIDAARTVEQVTQDRAKAAAVEMPNRPKKREYTLLKTENGFIGESKDVESDDR